LVKVLTGRKIWQRQAAGTEFSQKSYWNEKFNRHAQVLMPGDCAVIDADKMMVTVLGSCVAVYLHDKQVSIAGMNHFMLPGLTGAMTTRQQLMLPPLTGAMTTRQQLMLPTLTGAMTTGQQPIASLMGENYDTRAGRYGNQAMELLINEMLKAGANKSRFEAKIFGGASVINTNNNIGAKNIEFASQYLQMEDIPVINSCVGGFVPLRIHALADSNAVYVKRLGQGAAKQLSQDERVYRQDIAKGNMTGEIYFFQITINYYPLEVNTKSGKKGAFNVNEKLTR
jgi:chemotaxis protein CheD